MIIAEYSNSVNTTDEQLAVQNASDLDAAIIGAQRIIDRNEDLLADLHLRPAPARIVEMGIYNDGGNHNFRPVWHWTKQMRNGDVRVSSETYWHPWDAALAAERMAACNGAPLSEAVQQELRRQVVAGYELRLFGKDWDSCTNKHQRQGYQECIIEEMKLAIERDAVIEEKDSKPGLDAQQWPPDDEPSDDEKWFYCMHDERDEDPCGIYDGWGDMR